MPNNPFDREVINPRERPLAGDLNFTPSFVDVMVRQMMMQVYQSGFAFSNGQPVHGLSFVKSGFPGDAFMPVAATTFPTTTNKIRLLPGVGFSYEPADVVTSIGGIVGVDDLHPFKPLVLSSAAPESAIGITLQGLAGNPRWDIIEVKKNRLLGNATSRDILNPGTGVFAPGVVNKLLSYTLDGTVTTNGSGAINVKQGVQAVSPVEPATTAGYIKIAAIRVPGGAVAAFTQQNIIDYRPYLSPSNNLFITGIIIPNLATGVFGLPAGVKMTMDGLVSPFRFTIVTGGSTPGGAVPPMFSGGSNSGGFFPNAIFQFQSTFHNGTVGDANHRTSAQLAASTWPIYCENGQPCTQVNVICQNAGVQDFFFSMMLGQLS